MSWTNYHSHTNFSDGSNAPEDYIREAISNNMKAYGFSCHAPVPFNCKWTIPHDKLNDYLNTIDLLKETYKGTIQIYKSLEIDYFPGNPLSKPENIMSLNLDYVIGSIHFVDNLKNGEPWNIDTSKRIFDAGMVELFDANGREAVTRYFTLTKEMIEAMNPTIIGHIDKIKIMNHNNQYYSEDDTWYEALVDEILDLIQSKGNIIEINTRGTYKFEKKELYPSISILKKIKKLSIPVTINSDNHRLGESIKGFDYAAEILNDLGFKTIRILYNNSWIDVPFNKNGVIL
ncbi:MAG: histidinol-phosphatase [Bacteroidales bacterium]